MDLIFAGLVRKFGKENVIDWPPRDKHRQGKPQLVGDDEKDYGAERRSLCYVEGCEDLKRYTPQEIYDWTDSHRCADLGHEQATIWTDETDESLIYVAKLLGMSSKKAEVVIIAGHDSFRGDPFTLYKKFPDSLLHRAMEWGKNKGRGLPAGFGYNMFIDDWKPEYDKLQNTHLINLSCNFDHLWDVKKREEYLQNKVYDVCFLGYNSNPVRKVVIDHIKERWGHLNNCLVFEERPNQFDRFVRHDEMFKMMAQSKICLNLPGASTNGRALRYYEIPYVGSFMLSLVAPVVYLDPPMGAKFVTLDQLDVCIEYYLNHDSNRESCAELDHKNCIEHHSIDARMDYIFGVLDG